ncbi:hypothetical protein [Parasphingopyxis marina]|uniref:Uncharacterized protein n=1 Tax=Parasphingopyxis marina TaxID=2761622 RepID=A0A842HTD5_9SPHN|nr:hypothetical protein [Parasphingopyxis marina]MBC2776205.1 hypothetical protein [Parasphingopyxis marina]
MAGKSGASRRYTRRMAAAMTIYLAAIAAGEYLIDGGRVAGPLLWFFALLPGLAIAAAVYVLGLYIVEETDEFIRMITVHQALIATGLTLTFAAIWGFLENYGLVGHFELYWIVVLWFFGFGIGALVARAIHGSWGMHR